MDWIAPDADENLANIRGWRVIAVNGTDVSQNLYRDVIAVLKAARRPVTMHFSGGPSQEHIEDLNKQILNLQYQALSCPADSPERLKLRAKASHLQERNIVDIEMFKKEKSQGFPEPATPPPAQRNAEATSTPQSSEPEVPPSPGVPAARSGGMDLSTAAGVETPRISPSEEATVHSDSDINRTSPSHLRRASAQEILWQPIMRESSPSRVRVDRSLGGRELDGIQVAALSLEPDTYGEDMPTERVYGTAGRGDLRACCMGANGSGDAMLAACGEASGMTERGEDEASAIPEQCAVS